MPVRANLCDPPKNIHNWFSLGPMPTDPKQFCSCNALRLEQKTDEVKHSAAIFVNGAEIGKVRMGKTTTRPEFPVIYEEHENE